ncbi:hypothetical protein NDN08_001042 [Rhodosorus marinus]|uniref:Uncharacterized protein n=1 Tax=Rhodosorus marinus TaxID=101924 RepID=A0AAV8UR77_9RHOD|nr:hypothetical protein NDN08_001042 [Rhodosorus marinus]
MRVLWALCVVLAAFAFVESVQVSQKDLNALLEQDPTIASIIAARVGEDAEAPASEDDTKKHEKVPAEKSDEKDQDPLQYLRVECISCGEKTSDYYAEEYGLGKIPVYTSSELQGDWKTCTEASGDLTNKECYVDDEFEGQIRFDLIMGLFGKFDFQGNTVSASGGSANPVLYVLPELDELTLHFHIDYNCKPSNQETSELTLKVQVDEDDFITFKWLKVCGQGKNDKILLRYKEETGEKAGEMVAFSEKNLVVGEDDASTQLELKLIPPVRDQPYEEPKLVSDNEDIEVSFRRRSSGEGGMVLFGLSLLVVYGCKVDKKAEATITMTIPVPPWDPVVATWKKKCKPSTPSELNIGTSLEKADVIANGVVAKEFNIEYESGLSFKKSHYRIDLFRHNQKFYVSNQDNEINIHEVIIETKDNSILEVQVVVPKRGAADYIREDETQIGAGQRKILNLRFICFLEGETSVLVTLSTAKHGPIEFGFVKACYAGVKVIGSGFLRTSGSLFYIFIAVGVVVAVSMLWGMRKYAGSLLASRRSYAPVAQARPGGY